MYLLSALCACVTFGGLALISHRIARENLEGADILTRWLGGMLFGMTLATALFHGLLWPGLFDRWIVCGLVALALSIMSVRGWSASAELSWVLRDARSLASSLTRTRKRLYSGAGLVTIIAFVVTAARCLALRPMAWDTLTYHGVKAAMWVQAGGPLSLDAPGGWSFYHHRFGGAEALLGWAMLPTGNDLLACFLDVVLWFGLGCAVWALGRELGLRAHQRIAACTYALFIPATWSLVGTSYVELPLSLALVGGLAFAARSHRTGERASWLLAMAAFGLAAGIRSPIAPVSALACLLLLLHRLRGVGPAGGWTLLAGAGLAAMPVAPWLIDNICATGYPLDVPLTIGGVRVGAENAAFSWFEQTDITPYAWAHEAPALKQLFAWSPRHPNHLSLLTALPIIVALGGAGRLWRRSHSTSAITALVCCGIVATYYSEGFSLVRIVWAKGNGRFLLPVAIVAVVVSLLTCRGRGPWARAYPVVLLLGAGIHICMNAFHGWSSTSASAAAAILLVGLSGSALLAWLGSRRSPASQLTIAAVGLCLCVLALSLQRDMQREYVQLRREFVRHPTTPYWRLHAYSLEHAAPGRRIAITSGPKKRSDHWPLYYFLGRDLQHTLHYIPIGETEAIIDLGPGDARERMGSYSHWLARLEARSITHVMSFRPASVELGFMRAHPERFEPFGPKDARSGLYRVLPPEPAAP